MGVHDAKAMHKAVVDANRSRGTFQTASSTIARLIFDWPAVLSTKRIGTSTTRKPLRNVRYVVSIWKT